MFPFDDVIMIYGLFWVEKFICDVTFMIWLSSHLRIESILKIAFFKSLTISDVWLKVNWGYLEELILATTKQL